MSRIKSKDTKIEIRARHWLFNHGIRYRKNCKDIQGKPDIAIKKYKIAVFFHGCFWHAHENCKCFHLPKSNVEYWEKKFKDNKNRDKKNISTLESQGWKVFVVWECELKSDFETVMDNLYNEIMNIKNKNKKLL